MTLDDLIDRVKSLPQDKAKQQIKRFMVGFIGPPRKGDILRNRFKREQTKKVEGL